MSDGRVGYNLDPDRESVHQKISSHKPHYCNTLRFYNQEMFTHGSIWVEIMVEQCILRSIDCLLQTNALDINFI
jgi:hypothetical protein